MRIKGHLLVLARSANYSTTCVMVGRVLDLRYLVLICGIVLPSVVLAEEDPSGWNQWWGPNRDGTVAGPARVAE